MAIRTLTIPPFAVPGGSHPEVDVTISLVDSNNRRIQGTVTGSNAVIDRVSVRVHEESRQLDLYPQDDIDPISTSGSNAIDGESFYLVDVTKKNTRFHSRVRTTLAQGGALSWYEFLTGVAP